MSRVGIAAAFVTLLCLPSASNAEGATPPTADELIAKYVEARGGREKIAAIHSLRLVGKSILAAGDFIQKQPVVILIKRPGMVREESNMQGLTAITAFDGTEGWSVRPFGGRREPQKLAPDMLKELRLEADIDGPLLDYQAKGSTVTYMGTEDVDGTEAHKLKVTLRDGDDLYVYLDPDYFLEIRELYRQKIRDVVQETETDFGAYREVAGVYMPFSIEIGEKGEPKPYSIVYETIEPNVAIEDSLYRFPSSAEGNAGTGR